MKIVIDIPDRQYELLQRVVKTKRGMENLSEYGELILNGTPLPKGHGDLIDRNELLKHYDNTTYHNGIEERKIHFVQIGYVNDAQPIIEADKEKK